MKPSTMFTRRIPKDELGTWLNLAGRALPEQIDYAESFIALPDTIYFLASIGGENAGGTAIYRDRARYAVALVDAFLHPDHRSGAELQLLKSSLPFFRTVVIREADVLLDSDDFEEYLPSPMATRIASSFRNTLEALGFHEVAKIHRCSIDTRIEDDIPSPMSQDETPNRKGALDLFWKQSGLSRLDCSQVTLALEVAGKRGALRTWTTDGTTVLAMGIERLQDRALVWPILADLDVIDDSSVAREIAAQAIPVNPVSIELPLVGQGQLGIIKELAKLVGSQLKTREATLMRKKL
ncbi:MAG: hypothetical protein JSW05_01795 [Candidatus Thorarchaeota archaeon]|nr:MAG: hypothetical protein JSW05_01795 [Candidatus Thorarchaeota archaeon]